MNVGVSIGDVCARRAIVRRGSSAMNENETYARDGAVGGKPGEWCDAIELGDDCVGEALRARESRRTDDWFCFCVRLGLRSQGLAPAGNRAALSNIGNVLTGAQGVRQTRAGKARYVLSARAKRAKRARDFATMKVSFRVFEPSFVCSSTDCGVFRTLRVI